MSKYIFHLGMTISPAGNATAQRVKLTLKGLRIFGFYTMVINKKSNEVKALKTVNLFDGIPFVFTSKIVSRPDSFFLRNINKITGILGEIILLYKKRKKLHTAILYTPSFGELVYYRFLSKLLGFKVIIQYVELRSSIPERNTLSIKLNDKLFDNYFYFFCDGVITISDFLVKHVISKSKRLPLVKMPAICDFNEFNDVKPNHDKPYLMYCGTIHYFEVIELIIDVFTSLKTDNKYDGNLLLVISGNDEKNWENIKLKIKSLKYANDIIIKSSIPYIELLTLYKSAELLMVPLRDTIQDNARFPHKIGEYSASKRPILTTNLEEMRIYFIDGESAILAENYSRESYVKKLSSILSSRPNLDRIGNEGYKVGLQFFDYSAQAETLKKFILSLSNGD